LVNAGPRNHLILCLFEQVPGSGIKHRSCPVNLQLLNLFITAD
jgi:hypothetical protein